MTERRPPPASALRTLIALLIGVAAATLAIGAWQVALWTWWQPPLEGEALLDAPGQMLWTLLAGYMLGAALGGGVSARLGGEAGGPCALAVGTIQTAVAVLTLARLPHPLWFTMLSPLVHVPAALAGARLALGRWPFGRDDT